MHHVTSLVRAGLLLGALLPSSALACSFIEYDEHLIDDTIADEVAPGLPTLDDLSVTRGVGPTRSGFGSQSVSSCDDLGWITLALSAEDDLSAPESLGFVFALDTGSLPFTLPSEAVRPFDGSITFVWIDEATDEQEPIEATVTVNTVDEAGNVSAESLLVTISDEGREEGLKGCSTGSGAPGVGLGLLGLLAVRRRRARREA
jgi:MYXO-CTERM domain-containing protein